jgi:hypothetical protein
MIRQPKRVGAKNSITIVGSRYVEKVVEERADMGTLGRVDGR